MASKYSFTFIGKRTHLNVCKNLNINEVSIIVSLVGVVVQMLQLLKSLRVSIGEDVERLLHGFKTTAKVLNFEESNANKLVCIRFNATTKNGVTQENLKPIVRAKTFLRLISAVKKWSITRWASQVLVHVTTGANLKSTDKLLRRSGAKCVGGGYVFQ